MARSNSSLPPANSFYIFSSFCTMQIPFALLVSGLGFVVCVHKSLQSPVPCGVLSRVVLATTRIVLCVHKCPAGDFSLATTRATCSYLLSICLAVCAASGEGQFAHPLMYIVSQHCAILLNCLMLLCVDFLRSTSGGGVD